MKTHNIDSFRGRRASDKIKRKASFALDIAVLTACVSAFTYLYFFYSGN
jgi:hypothetical protein